MTTMHTAGPWNIHPAYINDGVLTVAGGEFQARDLPVAQGDKIVAHANFWTAGGGGFPRVDNEAEMLANARLIAAAPDLLKCLQLCEGNISSLLASAHPKVFGEWLETVRAAIAAATGQED